MTESTYNRRIEENIKHSDEIERIIKGCKRNSLKHQKQLYDRCFETLYVHCQKYRLSDEDSISLINQTMERVFKNIDTYRKEGSLDGWIYRIHKNIILNHFRSIRIQKKYFEPLPDPDRLDIASDNDLHSWINLEQIFQALDHLSDLEREIVILYAVHGFNHREISERLKISESASKWHMENARAEISKFINYKP